MIFTLATDATAFVGFYGANLRFPLFSGFLSLGGFLFAAKAFIVVHMKKEVYDTERYRVRLAEQRRLDASLIHYKPLKNLNDLLFWAVVCSLGTATAQMTIGLLPFGITAGLCVAFAIGTLVLLFICLYHIRKNMKSSISDLEEDASQESALS